MKSKKAVVQRQLGSYNTTGPNQKISSKQSTFKSVKKGPPSRQSTGSQKKDINNIHVGTHIESSCNELDRAQIKDSHLSDFSQKNRVYALKDKTNFEVIDSGSMLNIMLTN
jgi:hypothetical protein